MQKVILSVIALLFACRRHTFGVKMQTTSPTPHFPRGTATDLSSSEIQAAVQKTASAPVSDQAMRVVSINGEYNVGVGVVHRAKSAGLGCWRWHRTQPDHGGLPCHRGQCDVGDGRNNGESEAGPLG